MNKRIGIILACLVPTLFLGGCGVLDEAHLTKREAEQFAEGLTGEDITYLETIDDDNTIGDDENRYFVMADEQGREFVVISRLSYPWIGGGGQVKISKKRQVSENYVTSMLINNKEEILEILEKYGLAENLYKETVWDSNIYEGDGSGFGYIKFEFEDQTRDLNLDRLKRVAKAAEEIDKLLSFHINLDYAEQAREDGFFYMSSFEDCTIKVCFYSEEYNYDIAECRFSFDDDSRLTEDLILKTLQEELEDVKFAPIP